MTYQEKAEIEHSNTICIDFDDVIYEASEGWKDGTLYGTPTIGAAAVMEILSRDYDIVVCSCKCLVDRPLVNGKSGVELIWEWLGKYNLRKYVKQVTSIKPRAKYYIDDRAIKFTTWSKVLNEID